MPPFVINDHVNALFGWLVLHCWLVVTSGYCSGVQLVILVNVNRGFTVVKVHFDGLVSIRMSLAPIPWLNRDIRTVIHLWLAWVNYSIFWRERLYS